MAKPTHSCPCGSGTTYAACCGPFHRGEREAPDAPALMRSRYAAFVTKDVDYLWRTLHPDHEDRARPADDVRRALSAACNENRYLALRVLDASGPDANAVAHVLFAARVFHRGRDASFVEHSEFEHDGVGWRYVRGEGMPMPFEAAGKLTLASFAPSLSTTLPA
jgi:SEC-C motif-containing protein